MSVLEHVLQEGECSSLKTGHEPQVRSPKGEQPLRAAPSKRRSTRRMKRLDRSWKRRTPLKIKQILNDPLESSDDREWLPHTGYRLNKENRERTHVTSDIPPKRTRSTCNSTTEASATRPAQEVSGSPQPGWPTDVCDESASKQHKVPILSPTTQSSPNITVIILSDSD